MYTAQAPSLFETIAQDLRNTGIGIYHNAIAPALVKALYNRAQQLHGDQTHLNNFIEAGVGRADNHTISRQIRKDKICWINDQSTAEQEWLQWAASLQTHLNRQLFLGLFSFESHFALYQPGDFYRRHSDAFRGQANRVLTLVLYLNPEWQAHYGGELLVYQSDEDQTGVTVLPEPGTLVVFLSEEFPHQVLPTQHDRYSIAGWFRVNTTTADRLDPPR